MRDLGFGSLKACGGLRDQVCIHQTERVASEILDWSQKAGAQHGRKKEIVPERLINPPTDPAITSVPCGTSTNGDQSTKERTYTGPHAACCADQTCKEYTSRYRKFYAIWLRRLKQLETLNCVN